jgi:hypothetical protein
MMGNVSASATTISATTTIGRSAAINTTAANNRAAAIVTATIIRAAVLIVGVTASIVGSCDGRSSGGATYDRATPNIGSSPVGRSSAIASPVPASITSAHSSSSRADFDDIHEFTLLNRIDDESERSIFEGVRDLIGIFAVERFRDCHF